jgi:hypothetical protein
LEKAETRKYVKHSDRYRRFGKFQGAGMHIQETLLKNIFIFFDWAIRWDERSLYFSDGAYCGTGTGISIQPL